MDQTIKKYKVALVCICINPPYWQYIGPMIESARKHFLVNHDVDYLLWSDMPKEVNYGATIFEADPVPFPYPTLMRFHLFLQQEEKLKEYDYIFYCDADMLFVNTVGDEVLGDGITCAEHPMYALKRLFIPPYEPNKDSSAYIPRLGVQAINEHGRPYFKPLYAAGGFQGGKSQDFIKAMKWCKRSIDDDFARNYIAIWNDESHWNRYLLDNPPSVILSPSYIYPDSMIKEYYEPIWGCSYVPRLVTITKKFSVSKEGGQAVQEAMTGLKQIT